MALDWLRCRAWDPFGTVVAAAVCVAGVGLGDMDHRPSLCVAGVALGDIDRHFAWQAWHLWHWTGSGGALGTYTHTYIHTYLRNPSAGKKRDGPSWFEKTRWKTKIAIKPKKSDK